MRFKQITIIGVGLIGGSVGLAVRKKGLASRIVGVTAHKRSIKKALRRKAIDIGTLDIKKSVLGSEMVVLATPVDKILTTLKQIKPYLKKGCIVIDVASVKQRIVNKAERIIGSKGHFVGTHPMAGSEQRGVDKAKRNLFVNSPCVLTRTGNTNRRALKLVNSFWKALGSKIYVLSPREHDSKIGNISHLPHVAASCLSLVPKSSSMAFASTGFKDATRIASGDPALWASILILNRNNVSGDIAAYSKQLKHMRHLIAHGREGELKAILFNAKKKRDKLNTK